MVELLGVGRLRLSFEGGGLAVFGGDEGILSSRLDSPVWRQKAQVGHGIAVGWWRWKEEVYGSEDVGELRGSCLMRLVHNTPRETRIHTCIPWSSWSNHWRAKTVYIEPVNPFESNTFDSKGDSTSSLRD